MDMLKIYTSSIKPGFHGFSINTYFDNDDLKPGFHYLS